jgi:hypothetical protein
MNQVVEWLKANVAIIVFAVVILASLIALPLIASGMNESVRSEIQTRGRALGELSRIEQTAIRRPDTGQTQTGHVNERLLEQLRRYVEMREDDSTTVLAAAIDHNRRDHRVLMPELFPRSPEHERAILSREFHAMLMAEYDRLLSDLRVGTPPPPTQLAQELHRREVQFRTSILQRQVDEELSAEEQEQLVTELRSLRLLRYQEAAEGIRFYFDRALLNLPEFDRRQNYSLNELFEWQWRFWIHSDILRALASANEQDGSVVHGPVKRVLRLSVSESPAMRRDASGAQPARIDPAQAVPTDYSISLTGRRSNHLYDVRYVDLDLIVDSRRMYEVLQAISAYNFMTVVNTEVREADPYEAARAGYFYGTNPVLRMSLRIETVWFREWTTERMPDETLRALGVQVDRPAPGGA